MSGVSKGYEWRRGEDQGWSIFKILGYGVFLFFFRFIMCFDTFFRLKDLGTFYEIKMNILERHVSRLVGRISQFRLVDEQFNRILLLSLYTVQRDTFLFLFFLR